MNKQEDKIRQAVEQDYAGKVTGKPPGPTLVYEKAGYQPSELEDLPRGLADSSFGCGNPVALSGVKPGDTVVDLGSGAGLDLFLAAKRTGPSGRVIGIDMTDAMLDKARAGIEKSGHKNIEVRKGIIESLLLESSSVDWVISNCVVNLSPNKKQVFEEIARVLRPGGQMLISDIVVHDPPGWVRWLVSFFNEAVAAAIDESKYVEGLKAAGLDEVEIKDRLVYDEASIYGMIRSEFGDTWMGNLLAPVIRQVGRAMNRKITSIQISAKKL